MLPDRFYGRCIVVVCSGCGALLIDGTKKCPFCKEILFESNGAVSDMTYKIDSKNQVDLIKNTSRASISLEKRRENRKKKRRKMIAGYAILLGIATILIAIIIGIISLFVNLFTDNTVYSTVFYSNNEMELYYKEKIVPLTGKIVGSSNDSDFSIKNENIVAKSKEGNITCFLDNYDTSKKQGTLKVIIKDNNKNIRTVSENVSGGFLISDNGEHILFIKNGNIKGNRGELWYSNKGKKPVKIADKVDRDKVIFSDNFEKVLYIKNYNYKTLCGDACVARIGDFSEEKIDTEVYAIYKTADKGRKYIYSKNFDKKSGSYDLYLNHQSEKILIAMGCGNEPVFSNSGKYIFTYGEKSGERYNLYRTNIKKASTEKIVSNMNQIIKISDDGKQVLYSKLFDNNVGDYYIWTEGETELKVADGVNYTKKNQVAVSDDFKTVTFIANYNEDKLGGLLYYCEYDKDKVSIPEKISDDVYNCYVLNNGKIVYNKNYSSKSKIAQLYVYDGVEAEINKEINPRFLTTVDNNIVCIYDYNSDNGGNLYIIDENMNEVKLLSDVFDFIVKDNGELLIEKNNDTKNKRFDLYETVDKEQAILIKKDVEGIILY